MGHEYVDMIHNRSMVLIIATSKGLRVSRNKAIVTHCLVMVVGKKEINRVFYHGSGQPQVNRSLRWKLLTNKHRHSSGYRYVRGLGNITFRVGFVRL